MVAQKSSRKSVGRKSKSTSQARSDTTLFDLLKKDHENVKNLFEQIQEDGEMGAEAQGEIFSQIREELSLHIEGEEEFFYPALEEPEESHEKVLEAYEEHHVAQNVLGEIDDLEEGDERWKAKVKVLQELVEHHIEEEEKEVFKLTKKVLDRERIQEIANQIQAKKGQKEEPRSILQNFR